MPSQRLLLALLCAALPSAAQAADETAALRLGFDLRHQVLGYGTFQDVLGDSSFNPGNAYARLPERAWDAEYRGDVRVKAGPCSGTLKLRLQYTRLTEVEPQAANDSVHDGFVNTATLRCRLWTGSSLSVGRDVVQWGNGTLRSPSNPFFIDTGKISPIRELYGKDIMSFTVAPNATWSFSLLHQYGIGRRDPATPFRPVSALKADWVGETATAGVVASAVEGGPRRLGGYATWTASRALLWYGEASVEQGSDGWFAERVGPGPLDLRMAQTKLHSHDTLYSLLGGASYTFESGWTLNGEILHNNEGYSDAERRDVVLAAHAAAVRLFSGAADGEPATDLARALDPNLRTLGRGYVFAQLLHPELFGRLSLVLRATRNLDDHSSSLATVVNYNLNPNVQLFAFGTRNFGSQDSEFRRLLGYSVQAGVRLFY